MMEKGTFFLNVSKKMERKTRLEGLTSSLNKPIISKDSAPPHIAILM